MWLTTTSRETSVPVSVREPVSRTLASAVSAISKLTWMSGAPPGDADAQRYRRADFAFAARGVVTPVSYDFGC